MTDFSQAKIIPAPNDPADIPNWREALLRWREEEKTRLAYDDTLYRQPEFAWAQRCFAFHFAMLSDQMLMDQQTGRYTPEVYLEYASREFGGMDAIVLWHAYPNIGIDERNQFDFYRDAPGGLKALHELVQAFHAQGVRVFVDYNPWDTGTRREEVPQHEALAGIVGAMEADGVFLDTMRHGSQGFREAIDVARSGVVFESESSLPLEHIHDHHMSWAQWYADSDVPGVLRNKWFEPRHMMHHTRRWERDHHEELQSAWMNGAGILVWENVFGSWNGWNTRDRWLLRLMLPIQRRYAQHFVSGQWLPLVPTGFDGVYASEWGYDGSRLWTLINRGTGDVCAEVLEAEDQDQYRYFDLAQGLEIKPRKRGRHVFLRGFVAGRGIGALFGVEKARVDDCLLSFLAQQQKTFEQRSSDRNFPERMSLLKPTEPSRLRQCGDAAIKVESQQIAVSSTFRNRECGTYGDAAFVNVWKPKPPLLHQMLRVEQSVKLGVFALDRYEVSNQEYQTFLLATQYRPESAERYLAHWVDGVPAKDQLGEPVVYIDLEDARAYARWAGKRLPTEFEWQVAMEQIEPSDTARIWNWTESEHSDGRTRFCILKGGADYQAWGSEWYFDGGPQSPGFCAKFLLGSAGLNRRATIGFRCATDLYE